MEIFLNRVWATLASGINSAVTTLPLTTGHGARFGSIAAGQRIRIVFLDATLNVSEIAYITAISGDNATIERGSPASSHLAGDRIEHRIGKETLDKFMQAEDIQTGAETLLGSVAGVDTTTAAANPTLTAQAATGSIWKLPAAGANTGIAATLNIDGQGAVSIVRPDGTALQANDIPSANYPCLFEKRAGDFVLLNPANLIAQNGHDLVAQTHTAFTTGGTGAAYTLTTDLALTAYAANQRYRVKFHATAAPNSQTSGALVVGQRYTITSFVTGDDFTNVGAASNASGVTFIATGTTPTNFTHASTLTTTPTLNVSALGGKALMQYSGLGVKVACGASSIIANMLSDVEYDGTDFILLGRLPGAGAYQVFTTSGQWDKPAWCTGNEYVLVEEWAGGGGGSNSISPAAGGGGAYNCGIFLASQLGSSETAVVGSGGTVASTGTAGGTTSFGTKLYSYGGGGGGNAQGGAGGGSRSAGQSAGTPSVGGLGFSAPQSGGQGANGVFDGGGNSGSNSGTSGGWSTRGGGGAPFWSSGVPGNSMFGGGAGGSSGGGYGLSQYGGNGGAAGSPGVAPGGGGGSNGAGARGEIRVRILI